MRWTSLIVAMLVGTSFTSGIAQEKEKPPIYRGKTVKEWIGGLRGPDPRIRLEAALALGEAGIDAEPAVKALAGALKDPFPQIRVAAANALAGLGAEAAPAVPNLALLLRDPDPKVREAGSQALGEMGDAAVPRLIEALKDRDANVKIAVIITIDGLGLGARPAIPALGEAIKDTNAVVRRLALIALSKMGEMALETVPLMVEALRDKDTNVKNAAAFALVSLGRDALPEFRKLLKDTNANLRLMAVQALSRLSEDIDQTTATALVEALADDHARVRQTATWTLATLGTKARELGGGPAVVKSLLKLLQDKDLHVRQTAVVALGQVGLDDKDDITGLAGALKDSSFLVRGMAVQALGQYTHDEAPMEWRMHIIGHIAAGLRDKDRRVQFIAARLLVQEGKLSLPALIKVVEKGQGSARLYAAAVLGEIGADAADAVPALQKMSRDATPEGRQAAKIALSRIQP